MKLRSFLIGAGLLLVAGLLGGFWYWSRSQWIPAGYVGVMYDAQSGLQRKAIPPRRVFVPWRHQLYIYPTMLKNAVYTQDPTEGEVAAADGILATTADNANTTFDVSVVYHVQPDDVFKVFESFGPLPIEEIQTNHLRRAVRDALNSVSTRYDVFQVMGPKREEISQFVTQELRRRLHPKGLTVDIAMLCSCYPAQEIQGKINQRVNSYTELAISETRRQIAEIERSSTLIRAGAEAQARQISAGGTQERSIEMLRLQADEAAIERWSGQLPVAQARAGQTVFIDRELLNALNATGHAAAQGQ